MSRSSKVFAGLLLAAFALGLRLHHLGFESLWMDELRQVSYYPQSCAQILYNAATQQQPPLDYWIGHFVYLFSQNEFALRLPAALFGAGSVVLLALLVARTCSWPVAMVTGAIGAMLPFNLYFSQEARPYSIAIFLFLVVLACLDHLLSAREKSYGRAVLLFFVSTAFLYSRGLSPLVVVSVLFLILMIWRLVLLIREGTALKGEGRNIAFGGLALLAALAAYVPGFRLILSRGQRYADTSFSLTNTLTAGIKAFDPTPLWQAFVVQTEPLTFPLLILLGLFPFLFRPSGLLKRGFLPWISALLLPGACILNLFIFQAKTHLPFRPPYALYMLPLTLILSAVTFQGLWNGLGTWRIARPGRVLLLLLAAFFIFQSAVALSASKGLRKKTDWRGLARYLTAHYGPGDIVIFDALSPYGCWEPRPTFSAFLRYPKGESPLTYMVPLAFESPSLAKGPQVPVLILFHWREYRLTPHSPYPFLPAPFPLEERGDHRGLRQDPLLHVTELTGFSIISLRRGTGEFGRDAYRLIQQVCLHLPRNSSLVEIHLAEAGLARALGRPDWKKHLARAELLVKGPALKRLREMADRLRQSTPVPLPAEKT